MVFCATLEPAKNEGILTNDVLNLIDKDHIQTQISISSKKALFAHMSEHICQLHPCLADEELIYALAQRERLGSTCIGEGIAIPHCRLPHNGKCILSLYTLAEPLSYNDDNETVDIVALLLVPEDATDTHIELLSQLAHLLFKPELRSELKSAKSNSDAFRALFQDAPVILEQKAATL